MSLRTNTGRAPSTSGGCSATRGRSRASSRPTGVSLCVHRRRPKKAFLAPSKPTPQDLDGCRVIGIDPGKVSIMHAAEVASDGSVRSFRFTNARYRRESGMVDERARSLRWNGTLGEELREMARVTTKV